MKGEGFDLNKIREQARQRNEKIEDVLPEKNLDENVVNTREAFEALSAEEQQRLMEARGYTDMELFKERHFTKGDPDINKLRERLKNKPE